MNERSENVALPTDLIYANCLRGYRPMAGTPAFKALWVKALRSGEFQQARKCLRSGENNFCCMGVALNLIDPQGWRKRSGVSMDWRTCDTNEIGTSLREALQIEGATARHLADMNDIHEASFERIADWIENNL